MNKTSLGWIGLGNMGSPMSKRHLDAGYPVTVYNRSKEKESALNRRHAKRPDKKYGHRLSHGLR